MPIQTHRQENFAGRFRLATTAKRRLHNYPILRPGYSSVRVLDTKYNVGLHRMYCHSTLAEKLWSSLNFMLKKTHYHGNDCRMSLSLLVLRHMQRYFSNICDGTDVQAD